MVGASSCSRCRGTGSIRSLSVDDHDTTAVGDDLVERVEPKRLRVKTSPGKLASAGRKTGKGLSFKR
jgi:hypothetical protein